MKTSSAAPSENPVTATSHPDSRDTPADRVLSKASRRSSPPRSSSIILVLGAILVATLALFGPRLLQSARSAVPLLKPTASLARPVFTGAAWNINNINMPAKAENPNDPRWNSYVRRSVLWPTPRLTRAVLRREWTVSTPTSDTSSTESTL